MASIQEISSFNSYTGNAILGGNTSGSFEINTQPIQNLAHYTMLYNKAEKEQKIKEGQDAAAKMAELTSYDLTTAIPKDREKIQKNFDRLIDYAKKNPSVLNYRENPEGYIEYHRRKNEFVNNLQGAKTRSIAYMARQKAIADDLNPQSKAVRAKQLEETVENSDILTPIPTEDSYDLKAPELKAPRSAVFDVMGQDGSGVGTLSVSVPDFKDINAQALSIELGLEKDILDENSPEFQALTPEAQDQKRKEKARLAGSGRTLYTESANRYNEALNQIKDSKGQINVPALNKNGLLSGVVQQFENYNRYVESMKSQIKNGVFIDKVTGKALKFGMKNLDEADYQTIKWEDGISPAELVKVQLLGMAQANSNQKKYQQTDDALQWYQAQTDRQKANAAAAAASAGSAPASTGSIEKPATLFTQHINRLKEFFGKNGDRPVFVGEHMIDERTRIALGLPKPADGEAGGHVVKYRTDGGFEIYNKADVTTSNGASVVKSGAAPITVGTAENLAQGFINSVKTLDLDKNADKDGTMAEKFQTQSEARFRELFGTTSGKSIWDNWSTFSGTGQAPATTTAPTQTRKGKDGKTYTSTDGITWVAPDGTTVQLQQK
jgi:hypothetical protein